LFIDDASLTSQPSKNFVEIRRQLFELYLLTDKQTKANT